MCVCDINKKCKDEYMNMYTVCIEVKVLGMIDNQMWESMPKHFAYNILGIYICA